MTCDKAQLLPWLLNGSLETAERDEVRGHLATCEACRTALAATREAWEVFDQHIPGADLVSLAWGETPRASTRRSPRPISRPAPSVPRRSSWPA